MPSTLWSELYAKRSDWALRAYKDFVATVHPTLRDDLERQDHVTLVVYGPTQVGKTTLILTTLGIHAYRLADVSHVLRGGREAGKSATVLATQYGKSPDDLWRLGGGQGLSDADMLNALGLVRDRMEKGDDVGSDIVDIRIPRHFFVEMDGGLNVSIIDLPGTHAAQKKEIRHVARLAELYVPTADVVLLVTRADALGALNPAALQLECLKDWTAQPAKFRVVLTYTFSSASIQEWYREEAQMGHATAQSLRSRLYSQISTHDLPLPEGGSSCLFPLEFGDSWTDLASKKPDYFEGASAISQIVMSELVESLAAASNPYRRLAAAFDLNALVAQKKKRLDVEFETAKEGLNTEIKQVAFQFATSEKALELAMRGKDRATALCDYLRDERCINRLESMIKKTFVIKVDAVSRKTVAMMRWRAEEHIDGLIEAWRKLRFDDGFETEDEHDLIHDMSWLDLTRPSSPPSVGAAYEHLLTTLGNYQSDRYVSWLPGSSFDDDCELLRSSGERAQSIAIGETTKWLKAAMEQKKKAASYEQRVASKKLTALMAEYERSEKRHRYLLKRQSVLEKAHDETCNGMQAGIEHSLMFRERMTSGHRERDDELAKNIRDEESPSRCVLLLALRELHQREFAEVLEGHQT